MLRLDENSEKETRKHTESHQTIIRFLQVKLVLAQALLILHQVAVSHFVFKDGHVVSAVLHQRSILIGNFKLSSRDEEGLLLSQAAQRRSW